MRQLLTVLNKLSALFETKDRKCREAIFKPKLHWDKLMLEIDNFPRQDEYQ